jgi:hypothetical protein
LFRDLKRYLMLYWRYRSVLNLPDQLKRASVRSVDPMAHLVLADEPLPAEILAMLGSACDVRVWGDGDLDRLLGRAEGIYTYGHLPIDSIVIERAPNLKVISN